MNFDEIWGFLDSLGPVVLSILFLLTAFFLILVAFIVPIRWFIRYKTSNRRLREMWGFLEETGVEGHGAAADPARVEAAKRAANAIMLEHDRLFRRWPGLLFFLFRRKMERYPVRESYSGPSVPPKLAGFSKKKEPDAWMRQLFDTQIVHQLSPMEQMRKELRSESLRLMAIAVGSGICVMLVFGFFPSMSLSGNLLLPQLAGIATVFLLYKGLVFFKLGDKRRNYHRRFKESVFNAAARHLDRHVRYEVEGTVSRERFLESGMYKLEKERKKKPRHFPDGTGKRERTILKTLVSLKMVPYQGSDRFFKETGEETFEASIVTASRIKKGSKKNKTWESVFSGLFFAAPMGEGISGAVYGVPKGSVLKRSGRKRSFHNCRGIPMGDREFEKAFACYANDPVEAHQVLTPEFRRALLELEKEYPWKFQFSITGDQLSIGFADADSVIKPPLYRSILRFKNLRPSLALAGFVVRLPERLGLAKK